MIVKFLEDACVRCKVVDLLSCFFQVGTQSKPVDLKEWFGQIQTSDRASLLSKKLQKYAQKRGLQFSSTLASFITFTYACHVINRFGFCGIFWLYRLLCLAIVYRFYYPSRALVVRNKLC